MVAVRSRRYKLIHTYEDENWIQPSFVELYDLSNDADEMTNVAFIPSLADVRAPLEEALSKWFACVIF